jgi:hypothetical protein
MHLAETSVIPGAPAATGNDGATSFPIEGKHLPRLSVCASRRAIRARPLTAILGTGQPARRVVSPARCVSRLRRECGWSGVLSHDSMPSTTPWRSALGATRLRRLMTSACPSGSPRRSP